ncbi:hypothetical protein ABIA38_005322 [Embleya sp. AB8]
MSIDCTTPRINDVFVSWADFAGVTTLTTISDPLWTIAD